MNVPISAKQLRARLPAVVKRVRKGTRFTVIYRRRPAFQIVPVNESAETPVSLVDDPLYRAQAVGSSSDGHTAADPTGRSTGDDPQSPAVCPVEGSRTSGQSLQHRRRSLDAQLRERF